jgi:transposase
LSAAEGSNNQQIAAALKVPAVTVGKWRQSFAVLGLAGMRDAPRSGRPPKHDAAVRHWVQTHIHPEDETTRQARERARLAIDESKDMPLDHGSDVSVL